MEIIVVIVVLTFHLVDRFRLRAVTIQKRSSWNCHE